eukprot:m51a1_g2205 hypothetical protein (518) ;mRNA; r:173825-175672
MVAEAAQRREAVERLLGLLRRSLAGDGRLVMAHIATCVRLAVECPFPDVAETMSGFVHHVEQTTGTLLPKVKPASSYLAPDTVPPLLTAEPRLTELFRELFLQTGRVTHVSQVLAVHPTYLELHSRLTHTILRAPGPLPPHVRNYIAILAAARFDCQYLVSINEREFVMNQGDPIWLVGVQHAPAKIRALLELIALLAHRPWGITMEHIEPLLKGSDAWSVGELVSAVVIICVFLSLCGIVFGVGITPEIDIPAAPWPQGGCCAWSGHSGSDTMPASSDSEDELDPTAVARATETITAKLLSAPENPEPSGTDAEAFASAGNDSALLPKRDARAAAAARRAEQRAAELERYRGGVVLAHEDFGSRPKEFNVFSAQDYCWTEHGYELINRFFSEAASILDDLFSHIQKLTYKTFAKHSNIETDRFRRAIWHYVQRIHGVCHDDYDYHEVNVFLNIPLKHYVKKVVCYPQQINRRDFANFGIDLRPDEKLHVCLLAVESRKQAALLYALYAVMRYMTRK